MGIKSLSKVIEANASHAMSQFEMKQMFGRKVAIDASMTMYQFLVAVRSGSQQLTNENGEVTSHLQGMLYRTIRMLENGVKPVYVFDGKPPEMKGDELAKRTAKRAEATVALAKATEESNEIDMDRFSRRLVKVTPQHNDDCKKLLRLMGVPVIQAPGEAEAQCAAICKAGLVYGTATEDMDALTFGCPVLLRHMTFSAARKMPINEYKLDKVLEGFGVSMDEFIDLCILLGCDYSPSIKGVGPVRAFQLIQKHKSIEEVLKHIDLEKNPVPEGFNYTHSRELFLNPDVTDPKEISLTWTEPDEAGLIEFLVNEKQFNLERIQTAIKKLQGLKKKGTQQRIDSFFTKKPSTATSKRTPSSTNKSKPAKKAKK